MQQAGWHGPGVVMKPLRARRFGRFARPRQRLRAGLLQLLCAVAGLALGLLLPRITVESTVASARVSEALVAVLTALALIRSLQVKAFASIQLAPTLAAAATRPGPAAAGR
jgi:hypothetical protein